MMRLGTIPLLAALVALLGGPLSARAEGGDAAPDFKEVYETIRAHLTGMSETELNRAAVNALVSALNPKVALVAPEAAVDAPAAGALISKTALFEGAIGYVRIAHMEPGLDQALLQAYEQLAATNRLKGLVLDLRYAGGQDYAGAAATADLFLKTERPLLDWGKGMVRSHAKPEAVSLPVTVLVNAQTAAAAEALAGILRETGTGLILGARTAGQAMIAQEYPLKSGQRLRIATSPMQLGDGAVLSAKGLQPDIGVTVHPNDEAAYYADAFKVLPRTNLFASTSLSLTNAANGTNRPARRVRFNEAELVRERREGTESEPAKESEPEKPLVTDPVLARALDVLKGLALVRQSRS